MIWFTVTGLPVPKARPKFAVVRGKPRVYTPAKTRSWESHVAACAVRAKRGSSQSFPIPKTQPVFLCLTFWLPRPQRPLAPWPVTKPDLDNLEKAVMDGLTQAGVWVDDSQVAGKLSAKVYADGEPRVDVTVYIRPPEPAEEVFNAEVA